MDQIQRVLAKLKAKPSATKSGGRPSRFRDAADTVRQAAKEDDSEGFAKALSAAIRIAMAERGSDE